MAGSYSEQDAQEILRRAASAQSGFMSRDELLLAASELGISPQAVEQAERDYQEARVDEDLRSQFRLKQRQDFLGSFKVLAACGVIFWLLMKDGTAGNSPQHNIFAIVVALFGIWSVIKNGYFAFAEKSPAWQKSFEDFKVADKKRKARAVERTNDVAISDILQNVEADEKVTVIKHLRDTTGLPLNEAKSAVDDYYKRHPEILRQGN